MTANNAIFIDPRDSVATALRDLDAGERLDVAEGITLTEPVARGHKIAVVDIAAGAPVIKFGFPIGTAKAAIARGAHVHSHNMATRSEEHTSELQSLMRKSYAVFRFKKKKKYHHLTL